MRPNRSTSLMLLLLAGLFLIGCDTTLNIKSPAKNYYIKYFGNEGSQTGIDFVINSDGTIVLFGTTQLGVGDPRFYLAKADASGNLLWERTFGSKCQARDVELASDGRIVILGNMVNPTPGRTDYDILLMTVGQDGKTVDSVGLFGYTNNNNGAPANEDASAVTQTQDGGFVIAGSSDNLTHSAISGVLRDALFIRVNSDLSPYSSSWQDPPAYGKGIENVSTKIIQLPDASFIFFGYARFSSDTILNNDFNFWVFPLSTDGGTPTSGEQTYGSPNSDEKLGSVAAYASGFFLGGVTTNNNTQADSTYILQLRSPLQFDGTDKQNQTPKSMGSTLGKPVEHTSVLASPGSGYFLLTNDFSTTNSNIRLTKITANAVPGLSTVYGGPGDDFAGAVQELPDGRILIVGTMAVGQPSINNGETKVVLIKVNKDGQFSD